MHACMHAIIQSPRERNLVLDISMSAVDARAVAMMSRCMRSRKTLYGTGLAPCSSSGARRKHILSI